MIVDGDGDVNVALVDHRHSLVNIATMRSTSSVARWYVERVLEGRELRRVGGSSAISIDVRLIAATNRDLRREVNQGRFRSDLYYRLAVVIVRLPSLRSRPEDIPFLADYIARSLPDPARALQKVRQSAFLDHLRNGAWPGNVRELRNYIERSVLLDAPMDPISPDAGRVDARLPYEEARRRAVARFERDYIKALLDLHRGNVSAAARAAGVDRVYLHRLIRKHALKA